jgi:hypothetical protein
VANSLFNIGKGNQNSNGGNDIGLLMMNNLLMAQQKGGYGNNTAAYGRPGTRGSNRQGSMNGLGMLDQAVLGRLMFRNMPAGPAPRQNTGTFNQPV